MSQTVKRKSTARPQQVKSPKKQARVEALAPIRNEAAYRGVMARIDELMDKGSEQLSKAEISELRQLASLAESYEGAKYPAADIQTIAGLIDQKMFEMRLSQGAMARLLGVSDAKLSLILNGKQKLDVQLLKTIHQRLNIDANVLLDLV